jgi:hypothetical protein
MADPVDPAAAPVGRAPGLMRSLVWYLVIGGAKTAGSYAAYAGLVLLGCHPQVALVIAHVVVTVLGYPSHARLAFGVPGWGGFWWYVVVTTVIYGTNAGLLALFLAWGRDPLLAQVLCQFVTIPLGFLLLRWALRGKRHGINLK